MARSYNEKIVLNSKFSNLSNFINNISSLFTEEGNTIYKGRNILKTFNIEGVSINVKSFKKPHLINQIAYATIRKSKARRSYEHACKLEELGIGTPSPIAYIEHSRPCMLKQSYYISKQISFDDELRVLSRGTLEQHKGLILQFAQFTAKLHSLKVYHLDYSPGNILFKKQDEQYIFYLVDLNRMEIGIEIDLEKATKNFARLWGNEDMIRLFAEEYARTRNFDVEICVTLTLKYWHQFWDKRQKKYKGLLPYSGEK